MKKYLIRTVKILSLLLAILIAVGVLQEFVLAHTDHNRQRVKGFYLEDKDSLDVVFIGASEVYADYSSCYAYEKYGITSYPLASQSSTILNYKAQIQNAIKNQHPKLILCELNGVIYGSDVQLDNDANFRNYFDNTPLDEIKVEGVNTYIDSGIATIDEYGEIFEYYNPIVKYHYIWNDWPKWLHWSKGTIDSQFRGYSLLKGAKNKTQVFTTKNKIYNDELPTLTKTSEISENCEKYLRELLDWLKEENIDNVVFTRFPHIVDKTTLERYYRNNYTRKILEEYGAEYLDLERDCSKLPLDLQNDFYNLDHLNVYGQKKFTEYLCEYMMENYGITAADLTDKQKAEWDESVKYYEAYYDYNVDMIKQGKNKEIGESDDQIKKIEAYIK